MCISIAGALSCDVGTLVQPAAVTGACWSYWTPKAVMFAGMSAGDTKLVVTPRTDRKLRKSSVGPLMVPARPPAHSIWATFLPPRSADWASVSACRTFGDPSADVEFANGWPLTWNVL